MNIATNVAAQTDKTSKRLLVVSGGGARGAWGAGMATFLDSIGNRYDHIVGTSTGSLMAPLILLRKFDDLKRGYTTASQKDIFNIDPFHKDGSIRFLNAIFRICKPSLGTTLKLRDRIEQYMPNTDYEKIQNRGLGFTVAVVNFRTLEPAYKSSDQLFNYKQMVDWIWASSNEPVFMSPYPTKDSLTGQTDYWFDGGVRNVIPIRQGMAIVQRDSTYQAIDVIINSPPSVDEPASAWPNPKGTKPTANPKKPSLLPMIIRTLDTYGSGTREMNIAIGQLLDSLTLTKGILSDASAEESTMESGITLTFYCMPQDLYDSIPNELVFNPAIMRHVYEQGRLGNYITIPEPATQGSGHLHALTETAPSKAKKGTYRFSLSRAAVGRLLEVLK